MERILLNEYRPDIKFRNFPELDSRLNEYYDRIYDTVCPFDITPRYFYETGLKIAYRDIFYYIDMLYDNNPATVIDVGCGECIWKRWFPNIIGFDPNINEFSSADFVDYFDEGFSQGHPHEWTNGMALNSIHFIDWADIEKQIELALNIITNRFLFTFNFKTMKNVPSRPVGELVIEFHKRIDENFKIVMFDSPTHRGIDSGHLENWTHVNGTVRFILEK